MVSSKNVIALFWGQKGTGGKAQFPSPTAATDSSTKAGKTIKSSSFLSVPDRVSLLGFQTEFTYYNYLLSWQWPLSKTL